MKNAVVWSEIAVMDLKRATAFYEKLLDGKLKQESFGPFRIALFPHEEPGVGGTVTYLAATPTGYSASSSTCAAAVLRRPPSWRTGSACRCARCTATCATCRSPGCRSKAKPASATA